MNLILPDRVEARFSPQEVRLNLAVGMYSSGGVTMGTAAEIAGVSIPAFQRELGHRRIPVNYTAEDLAYDLEAAVELTRR